jgi:hypothetical protein
VRPGHCLGSAKAQHRGLPGLKKEKKGEKGGVFLKEEDVRNQYSNMMSLVKNSQPSLDGEYFKLFVCEFSLQKNGFRMIRLVLSDAHVHMKHILASSRKCT